MPEGKLFGILLGEPRINAKCCGEMKDSRYLILDNVKTKIGEGQMVHK